MAVNGLQVESNFGELRILNTQTESARKLRVLLGQLACHAQCCMGVKMNRGQI